MSEIVIELANQAHTAELAAALAPQLRAGDLIILTGGLGAGKTTFTQSLAAHMNVRGRVSSPTFIIAREHPSRSGGPALVHVDAYRLADGDELEDLDLDSELDESITVVEWGAGMAEQLSSDYLEITIAPVAGAGLDGDTGSAGDEVEDDAVEDDEVEDERRTVDLTGHGSSWADRMPRVHSAIATLEGMTTEGDAP